jgi:hypothetical protein
MAGPKQGRGRRDNEKAPPPVARGAEIRSIANSDVDQKKMREFPLFDLICILNRHLPSKRRISCAGVLLDVKTLRPREGGRNQRAEVESCIPLSKLHLRRAMDSSRIDSSGFLGLRDGNRCWVSIRNWDRGVLSLVTNIVVVDRVIAHHTGS